VTSTWGRAAVADALLDAIVSGEDFELRRAFRDAEVADIVAGFVDALDVSEPYQELSVRALLQTAAQIRSASALRGRVKKVAKNPKRWDVSQTSIVKLSQLVDQVLPDRGGEDASRCELAERISQSCTLLHISPLIQRDLISKEIDADVLPDVDASDLLAMTAEEARALAKQLADRSRKTENPAVQARMYANAAKMLLSQANARDSQSEIFFHLSGYCCRQGQVFGEGEGRLDVAEDYLVEAVVAQKTTREFPTLLYLRAVLRGYARDRRAVLYRPQSVLDALKMPLDARDDEGMRRVGLALLKLAARDRSWVLGVTEWRSQPEIRREYGRVLAALLDHTSPDVSTPAESQFDALLDAYRERIDAVGSAARMAVDAEASLAGVGRVLEELRRAYAAASPVLAEPEREALGDIASASESASRATAAKDASRKRVLLKQALNKLEDAEKQSSLLTFGVSITAPIVARWSAVFESALVETSKSLSPSLRVYLARRTYLQEGDVLTVTLEVANDGPGVALGLQAEFVSDVPIECVELDADALQPDSTASIVVRLDGPVDDGIGLGWRLDCTDVEGRPVAFSSEEDLRVQGVPADVDFDTLSEANPFNAGEVVTDPKMFFGRDQLVHRLVESVQRSGEAGSLRILFGQRRVGKSSVLHFLGRSLENLESPVVVGRVTWLNFSRHKPGQVLFEIAGALIRNAKRLGLALPVPDADAYVANYSFEFNRLLDQIEAEIPDVRVAILIDEFDKAFFQFADPTLDYGEPFYSYLRSLSSRAGTALVLAGGEELPQFLRELGPSFNNAKRERATYLPEEDNAALVRNENVRLEFTDGAVSRVFACTQGNPFFTQMLCHDLYGFACGLHSLDVVRGDVDSVAQALVSERLTPESASHLYLHNGEQNPVEGALLLAASQDLLDSLDQEWHEMADLREKVVADASEIDVAVSRLCEREVLTRNPRSPTQVRIVMPLFSAWYRRACPLTTAAWERVRAS